jgi:hypothetical protein
MGGRLDRQQYGRLTMAHITDRVCADCGHITRHVNGVCSNPHKLPENREQSLFETGMRSTDMLTLIDCAYDIVEGWKPEGPYNNRLRMAWLKRARELGAHPSP